MNAQTSASTRETPSVRATASTEPIHASGVNQPRTLDSSLLVGCGKSTQSVSNEPCCTHFHSMVRGGVSAIETTEKGIQDYKPEPPSRDSLETAHTATKERKRPVPRMARANRSTNPFRVYLFPRRYSSGFFYRPQPSSHIHLPIRSTAPMPLGFFFTHFIKHSPHAHTNQPPRTTQTRIPAQTPQNHLPRPTPQHPENLPAPVVNTTMHTPSLRHLSHPSHNPPSPPPKPAHRFHSFRSCARSRSPYPNLKPQPRKSIITKIMMQPRNTLNPER